MRKQPKCPPTQEWVNKLWYMYTMEYYSAIKKNGDFTSFVLTWMEVEDIILVKHHKNGEAWILCTQFWYEDN